MDRYILQEENIPTRSEKNKPLYKKIYDAYDEFENLIIPSNEKTINPSELKKELLPRGEYKKNKINCPEEDKMPHDKQEIYDIKELIEEAVTSKETNEEFSPTLTNCNYLKKLNLNSDKTNLEQVKEMYNDMETEVDNEEEKLLKTANLSLDILSDLKSDNDKTIVTPPIKDEEMPDDENDFYSNNYKFSKKDFEDKKVENILYDEDDSKDSNKNFFFKIFILIFGISLVVLVIVYLFNYFNRV